MITNHNIRKEVLKEIKEEDVVDISVPAIEFIAQIAESSLEPILEYSIGALPVVKSLYSVFKRRQMERRINETIKELTLRQDRLEELLAEKNERLKFGDRFTQYLDIILFHEYNEEKIKYFVELLITGYERKKTTFSEERYLDLLLKMSLEEVNTILKIKNYVLQELNADHMVDIWVLNDMRRTQKNNPFYNIVEEEAWFIEGQSQISTGNNESILKRLMSFGLVEPRYGYYGNELKIVRYVMNDEAFNFCDFIEMYSGKKNDSFLIIYGKEKVYHSKFGKSLKVM